MAKSEDLNFNIERTCRYHSRREAFYDSLHKFSMGISILAGSSAFAAFFTSPDYAAFGKIASAIVAVVTTLNLIFSFSHKARDHQVLYRRFKQEAIALVDAENAGGDSLKVIEKRYLLIEVDESPIYRALDASCYNEIVRSMTSNGDEVFQNSIPLRWSHQLFMHFWRFSDTAFSPRGVPSVTATKTPDAVSATPGASK